jgi:hypothetical protein
MIRRFAKPAFITWRGTACLAVVFSAVVAEAGITVDQYPPVHLRTGETMEVNPDRRAPGAQPYRRSQRRVRHASGLHRFGRRRGTIERRDSAGLQNDHSVFPARRRTLSRRNRGPPGTHRQRGLQQARRARFGPGGKWSRRDRVRHPRGWRSQSQPDNGPCIRTDSDPRRTLNRSLTAELSLGVYAAPLRQ